MTAKTIQDIERQYNPEHDIVPGGPAVTRVEYQKVIQQLQERIELLERTVGQINARLQNADEFLLEL